MRVSTMVLCAALALGVAACGGDEAAPAGDGQRPGFELSDEQAACLKERGVELGQRGGPGAGGGPPPEGEDRPQQPPELSDEQREQFEQRSAKQTKAMEACGVERPERPPDAAEATR